MSATRCKKPHADILIGIEMTRERNLGIKKKHPVFIFKSPKPQFDIKFGHLI